MSSSENYNPVIAGDAYVTLHNCLRIMRLIVEVDDQLVTLSATATHGLTQALQGAIGALEYVLETNCSQLEALSYEDSKTAASPKAKRRKAAEGVQP